MQPNNPPHELAPHIVFYDGECGICNKSVQTLIKWDKNESLRYAPLQGKTASERLPTTFTTKLSTLVLLSEQSTFTKSDATLEILTILNRLFVIRWLGRLTPRWIRNKIYDLVAKNRYFFNTNKQSCQFLPQEVRKRLFLP